VLYFVNRTNSPRTTVASQGRVLKASVDVVGRIFGDQPCLVLRLRDRSWYSGIERRHKSCPVCIASCRALRCCFVCLYGL